MSIPTRFIRFVLMEQPNQRRASEPNVINAVLQSMQAKIQDWRIQQHGCNLLVKVAGLDETLAAKMSESGADQIAEKVLR